MSRFVLSSVCKVTGSFELTNRVVSSAYIAQLHFTEWGNEFTKTINKRGSKINPCGIPISMVLKLERVELIFTVWVLFSR